MHFVKRYILNSTKNVKAKKSESHTAFQVYLLVGQSCDCVKFEFNDKSLHR